jgi:hypothetical protein
MTEQLLEHIGDRVRAVLRAIAPAAASGCPQAASAARSAARVLGIAELLARLSRHEHARHPGNLAILRAEMATMTRLVGALEHAHPELARDLGHAHAELGRKLAGRESDDVAIARALERKAG